MLESELLAKLQADTKIIVDCMNAADGGVTYASFYHTFLPVLARAAAGMPPTEANKKSMRYVDSINDVARIIGSIAKIAKQRDEIIVNEYGE